jgi:membrane-bound serine protease (ClpP class)
MRLRLLQLLVLCFGAGLLRAAAPAKEEIEHVYVIPVREQIGSAELYIVRRGLKDAIDHEAGTIVLDIKTPGGALDATFEIMEALGKFPGTTIAFVNNGAMSAGAFISATTEEIWFAPDGIIGAAAPVSVGGQDIEATMKLKIVSYLKARVRAMSEGKGYRGQVISAMIDADSELKIDGKVLKEKGELLSLTASEAAKTYGDPARPLLAAGVARNLDDLIQQRFGTARVTTMQVTWSEKLAVWLNAISPMLLGLGMLALFIEFKTPGFGVFGVVGIALLAVVFLGNYVAGLSGHEPMLFFGLGLVLVAVEIFFVPGAVVIALTGLVLMFGALVWSMADVWPNEPITFSAGMFLGPLLNVILGVAIAAVLGALALRFLPHGWFWDRMILESAVATAAQAAGGAPRPAAETEAIVGRRGVAATALRPVGQVEIDGVRYEARVEVGAIDAGAAVVVVKRTDFALIVARVA